MRVLIVDDHILFRQGLTSLFQPQPNFEVVGDAGTVREAVLKACQLKPDLILMDFCLPDGTGVQAARMILSELPDCKIVFLTVEDTDEALFEAVRSGAKGYLLKNMPLSSLLNSLRAVEQGEPAISRAMTGRIFHELARSSRSPARTPDLLAHLSPREIDILREMATGATNQEIAVRLFVAENTVKHHVHNILSKLSLENRRQAARFAQELEL